MGRLESSDLFFFKIVLAILALLNLHVNFRIDCQSPTKKPVGILTGTALNLLDEFGAYYDLSSI